MGERSRRSPRPRCPLTPSSGFFDAAYLAFRRVLQPAELQGACGCCSLQILLGMDTMVMDNDEAPQRHGVAPTYKRVKSRFQPLQVTSACSSMPRLSGRRQALQPRRSAQRRP